MLELYHWEPNGACARVLITLKEKGLDFQSRYVDLLGFEQQSPDFLALNEFGETPVLVKDGEPFNESSYICEFLEESFPERPLMPKDSYARWQVRAWQKYVDDYLAAAVSELAWNAYGSKRPSKAQVEKIGLKERRDVWQTALKGLSEDQLGRDRSRVESTVQKMEEDLASAGWLAGSDFSLADIAVYAYVAYLPKITPDLVNADKAPRTMDWLKRVAGRDGVKAAMALAKTPDPWAVAAPGPEHVRWG